MNTFTAIANICRDPEALVLGERQCMKLRLADGTYGKNAETRFFDAIVSGPDAAVAKRLKSGDQLVISGTLVATSYKSKKGKMAGKTVQADSMPFAKILQITKSPSFFAGTKESDEGADDSEPDLETPPDDGESPLAGIV